MNKTLQDRMENYLDGILDIEESRLFETALANDAAVAAEFRQLLLLRELLGRLSPDHPPAGLVERIESAMAVDRKDRPETSQTAFVTPFGAVLGALKTGVRWTRYIALGVSAGPETFKGSMNGMQAIAFVLGPLREPAKSGLKAMRLKPKAMWKTALSIGWRRLWT